MHTASRIDGRGTSCLRRARSLILHLGHVGWILAFLFATCSAQAAANDIVLGASMARSPIYEGRTRAIERGSRLYFDKINASGGINGRKIKFIVYDDQNDGKTMVENATTLVEKDKVSFLFEFYGSIATRIVLPLLEKADILLLAPLTGQTYRSQVVRNVFSVRPGYELEAEAMVDYLVNKRGIKKIGIFNTQDGPSETGSVGRAATYTAMRKHGLEFTGVESRGREDLNMQPVADALLKAGSEAIVLWAREAQVTEIMQAAHVRGFYPLYFGGTQLGTSGFIEQVAKISGKAPEIYLTQAVPTIEATDDRLVREFLDDAKAAKLKLEQQTSGELEGYFNAIFVTELFKRAGNDLSTKHVREVLEAMKDVDVVGIKVTFTPKIHTGVSSAYLTQLKSGKLHQISILK